MREKDGRYNHFFLFIPPPVLEFRIPEQLSLSFFPSVRLGGKKGGEHAHNRAAAGAEADTELS